MGAQWDGRAKVNSEGVKALSDCTFALIQMPNLPNAGLGQAGPLSRASRRSGRVATPPPKALGRANFGNRNGQ